MKLSGKRLLILGGASVHCKIVEAAKRLGVYTIVADYLTDSPAKKIADESLLISILDVDAIVDWCKKNPVDGVINYCNDPVQKAHQQICERLGLPCYGESVEQILPLTNKEDFKKLCVECGVGIIPSFTEEDIMSGTAEYPLLIKPSDSRGSRGQSICHNKQEALDALRFAKEESFSGNAIIEKYMGGYDDIQLVYLIANGVPALVKVEDRYLGSPENGLDRLCIATVCPSKHEEEFRYSFNSKIVSMLQKLGIKNGPVFLQGFWTGNDVLLYDPGIRIPGDDFDYAYTAATGINLPELFVEYTLSGAFPNDIAEKINSVRITKATAMILPCLCPGKIDSIHGIDQIKNHKETLAMSVAYQVGDSICAYHNFRQRFAEFVLCCDSFSQLKESIISLFETLRVYNADNRDMLIERIDLNLLDDYI